MITNRRFRVIHEPPLYTPDPGHILVYDESLDQYIPTRPKSSTLEFSADDFKFKDQAKLGMNLNPQHLEAPSMVKADQLSQAARSLQLSELEQMQANSLAQETYSETPETPSENG